MTVGMNRDRLTRRRWGKRAAGTDPASSAFQVGRSVGRSGTGPTGPKASCTPGTRNQAKKRT